MALHLDIKDGKLTIRPSDLFVQQIDDIWQYDTAPGKPVAQKLLKYVFGVAERREDLNPFAQVHYLQRAAKVRRNVFGAEDHQLIPFEEKLVIDAIWAYEECNSTSETRAIEGYDIQIDEMTALLAHPDNRPKITQYENKKTGEIKFASNTKIINDMMVAIDKASIAKDNLAARLAKGKGAGGKNRRGVELSASEKGLIGYNPLQHKARNDAAAAEAAQLMDKIAAQGPPEDFTGRSVN